jgi:hypothetical protein
MMHLHDLLYHGQAQANAAFAPGKERIEYALSEFCG